MTPIGRKTTIAIDRFRSATRGEKAHTPDFDLLLRKRGEGHCERAAAKRSKKLPPNVHSMTLVACTRIEFGISMPSAWAVFILTINSNLVGCSIGRSPGLAPLRILST